MTDRIAPHLDHFEDMVDFTYKVTYSIWNGWEGAPRDPGLVERFYSEETRIHAAGGDMGRQELSASTVGRLAAFPDFHSVIQDVIWTGDEERGYRRSNRLIWTGTHTGPFVFGPATGRRVRYSTIANTVTCPHPTTGYQIVEEWIAGNLLDLARQLGLDPKTALERWVAANPEPGRPARPPEPALEGPGAVLAEHLDAIFNKRQPMAVDAAYTNQTVLHIGVNRKLTGPDGVRHYVGEWLQRLPNLQYRVDDMYWLQDDDDLTRVATQWTITHDDSSLPVSITGISHHHLQGEKIVAEWTEYDELALLRQIGLR